MAQSGSSFWVANVNNAKVVRRDHGTILPIRPETRCFANAIMSSTTVNGIINGLGFEASALSGKTTSADVKYLSGILVAS